MASRFILAFADVGSGVKPPDGALLFFSEEGQSFDAAPKDTFSIEAATPGSENANPVVADTTGVFPDIWIEGRYKVVLKDKNNVQIWEADPVIELLNVSAAARSFDTVSDMVADTGLVIGQLITVEDYADGNDSGYLFFTVVAAGTGADNGGRFIDLSGSSLQAEQIFPALKTVKSYGGEGGGVADDRSAIAAIDSDFTGFHFQDGTYLIGSDLTITGVMTFAANAIISIPTGVELIIDGEMTADTGQHFAGLGTVTFRSGSKLKLSWFATGGAGTVASKFTGWTDIFNRQIATNNALAVEIDGHFSQSTAILQVDTRGMIVFGWGDQYSSIRVDGAFRGWDNSRTNPNENGLVFYNFKYSGNGDGANTSLETIYINDANYTTISEMHIRSSPLDGVSINADSNGTRITNCVFDANARYDILVGQDSVATKILSCDCNKSLTSTGAMIGLDKVGSLFVDTINYNGFGNAPVIKIFGSSGNSLLKFVNVYAECGSSKGVEITDTAVVERLTFEYCNIQSTAAINYDLNNGQSHKHLTIKSCQNSIALAGSQFVDRTGWSTFDIKNIEIPLGSLDGASGVNARTELQTGHLITGGMYAPAAGVLDENDTAPNVENFNVVLTNSSIATSITDFENAKDSQGLDILFIDANTTIVHDITKIRLKGAVNVTGAIGDTMSLRRIASIWYEF